MRGCWILALAVIALLVGCGRAEVAEAGEDSGQAYDPMVKQFGEAVLRGDWATAYGMTTPEFQATKSQSQLQQEYDALVAEIVKDDPSYKPNMVEAGHGELPSNEQEAVKYGIHPVPPKSSWKAWAYAAIGEGDANGLDRGIDAWVLVTEQGGQAKFSHVEFQFGD